MMQWRMCEGGVKKLGDILDKNGKFYAWEEIQHKLKLPNCLNTYRKLISNLDLSKAHVVDSFVFTLIYTHEGSLQEGMTIWEYQIHVKNLANHFKAETIDSYPTRTFTLAYSCLQPAKMNRPHPNTQLVRLIVSLPKQRSNAPSQLTLIASMKENIAIIEAFKWTNGKKIPNGYEGLAGNT